jgi:hypothetical protein
MMARIDFKIGVTNGGRRHTDNDLTRTRHRARSLNEFKLPRPLEYHGFHVANLRRRAPPSSKMLCLTS